MSRSEIKLYIYIYIYIYIRHRTISLANASVKSVTSDPDRSLIDVCNTHLGICGPSLCVEVALALEDRNSLTDRQRANMVLRRRDQPDNARPSAIHFLRLVRSRVSRGKDSQCVTVPLRESDFHSDDRSDDRTENLRLSVRLSFSSQIIEEICAETL